ncbi:N-acetylglutamate synthase [Altererythrobacter epoxidivorans]|uniref:N-acetylglutamate synthase n=1 Tax=Altererythrobacter epoxidivorans TaxID=361183 RepID=A0A0M4M5Q7_9SPHN|nr:GNAT family N-acetyltransferase [Altererythrobacter epoxidivorans]ALE17428.1 N-acetylglutamate synthase [Altererythrobacter epoxidivorans]
MDRQPVLEGERLLLRPLEPADWDALYAIASDPQVWEQHPMHDRWREDVFLAFFDDALAKGGALAVIDKSSDAIIGSSRFQQYEPEDGGSVEIGWTFLAPRYWGKGINHEMKRLMLAHAFEFVERVDFRVGETNWRSRQALENIGAERTRRTELSRYDGKRVIHIVYEITRDSFASGPLAG